MRFFLLHVLNYYGTFMRIQIGVDRGGIVFVAGGGQIVVVIREIASVTVHVMCGLY